MKALILSFQMVPVSSLEPITILRYGTILLGFIEAFNILAGCQQQPSKAATLKSRVRESLTKLGVDSQLSVS